MANILIPIKHTVDLDKGTREIALSEPFIQGDNLAHRITLTLKRGTASADLSSASAYCYVINASRQTTVVQGTVSGNTVTATLNSACYAVPGRVHILVRLSSGGAIETPIRITASVLPGTTDAIIDPDNIVPSLSDLLAQISAMEAATAAAKTATTNANNAASAANAAATGANTATQNANTAAANANNAALKADAATAKWSNLDVDVTMLPPDGQADGHVTQTTDSTTFHLELPQGRVVNATLYLDDKTGILYQIVPNVPEPSLTYAADIRSTLLLLVINGYGMTSLEGLR